MDTSDRTISLPEKLQNEHKIQNAGRAALVLNAFRLNLKNATHRVYKFELKFECTYKKRDEDKTVDLSVGPKNDVATITRKRLLLELYEQMVQNNLNFFGGKENVHSIVYDCGINFYSPKKITDSREKFPLSQDSLSEISRSYLGRNVIELSASLLACGFIDLAKVDNFESQDRSVIQFLEILSNQQLYKNDEYFMFGNKMFKKQGEIQLQNDARVLKEGFQKNVRLIGDSVSDAMAIMQIDPKKSAFFPERSVRHFLQDLLPDGDLRVSLEKNRQLAVQQLKGLSVKTTHMTNNRVFVVHDITEDDCDNLMFQRNGNQVSVTQYFKEAYSISLRYSHLPCIVEKSRGANKLSFYPIEVLSIVAGQRVPLSKQSGSLTEQMIRSCQALPATFSGDIEKQKDNACISSSNPFFKAHKIGVDSQLVSANADVLFPPAIAYYNKDFEEPGSQGEMNWKLPPRRRYFVAAEMYPVWAAVIIQGGVEGNACQDFIGRIVESAKQRGMNIEKPARYEVFNNSDIRFIKERFQFFKDNNCRFVMFFTRDKLDPVHHTMKLMEIDFGITTQHVSKITMNKALGNKGAFLVIDNILLKLNLKLGGINHSLTTAKQFKEKNRISKDIVGDQWFSASRMFVGIDMSHAGSQVLYDRNTAARVNPSVVGMSYTITPTLKMSGTYWLQESRVTHVQGLQQPFREALITFKKSNGSYPRHVVVYRGGISEGEYSTVIAHEVNAMHAAFEELSENPPSITFIVVQRNSNYRIVPQQVNERARAMEQNVRPGTVLDAKSMHPLYTEFLLVGHKAIQGTANPVRCTVISDSCRQRISLEELEYMTYSLCYAHGIVTSPVSVPAPLYSASDLAKRGANNFKFAWDSESLPRSEDDTADFFNCLNQRLKPTINTKFWA